MNTPIMSKITDKPEKHVFPLGTYQGQKMMSYDVPNIHQTYPVYRDSGMHIEGYDYLSGCAKNYLTPLGVSNGTNTFANFQMANMVTDAMRPMFITGCVLAGLALILAAVYYVRPAVFGTMAKYVVYVVLAMFVAGLILVVLDRDDTF